MFAAVFPLVAYNLWKNHNGTAALAYAWPGLNRYWRMLANITGPYTLANGSSTFGMWVDMNSAELSTLKCMCIELGLLEWLC